MIHNPILKGFNPDPCICRRGDDYYIMVSSMEWFPGLPVYHSRDMKNWELYTHVLTDDAQTDLRRLPSAKGIWAPCLTWCEADGLFYCVYGIMNSTNARYFDVDNYVITAPDIKGPWSAPVYLHSAGFDASLFHDDDGRKWLSSMEWETREKFEKPGAICLVEYDPKAKAIVGIPKRIWQGATDRGCMEAPHIYKHNGWYYLICAEGGTGYNHCAAVARSKNVEGPYERDPESPAITAAPGNPNERADWDHLKPRYYNPESILQKCGHASIVETSLGEVYAAHLCGRPFLPELRCTLGRETALEKMTWTDDGWLRMADGSNLAKEYVEESALPEVPVAKLPEMDDFDAPELGIMYYSPRLSSRHFADLSERPGWLAVRGQQSFCSLDRVSLLARKLTSVYAVITTKMEFVPLSYQQEAGLTLFYDNMDYLFLKKRKDYIEGGYVLEVMKLENGERTDFSDDAVHVDENAPVYLRVTLEGKKTWFSWSADGLKFEQLGPVFETSKLSDEYCQYGEFTGTLVGIGCVDSLTHTRKAYFDFFHYMADETKGVE